MRLLASLLLALACSAAEAQRFSAKQLAELGALPIAKGANYADHNLARYGNHYLLLIRRDETGSAELHAHEADIFGVASGRGSVITGGKLVGAHQTKPGEMRATSISGGKKEPLAAGDIIHIPAGLPHQVLVDKAQPFTYFVIKVTGQ